MRRHHHHFRSLAIAGLLISALAGCAVVPYDGPPRYYGYPEPVYGPPVVVPVPVPYYRPWHHRHHHGYRGYRR